MTNKLAPSPIQKAWLAGFIDGEGFIGITFQSSLSPTYQYKLTKTSELVNLLEEIKP